jgi:nucleotide-binding universal stress UspA family protein
MKTILAPIDFSGVTDAVIATAAELARASNGKVVLLSVIQPPVIVAEYAPHIADAAQILLASEKNAERELAKLADRLNADFIAADSLHLIGSPIPHIVEQAEKLAADYIVMGSHGHTALYDLLVGSTTHGVLMRAKCPVVIVPAQKPAKHTTGRKRTAHALG